eukprot:gnl/MRDRNA2_/MRDRNA2_34779_c0_seq1.p1 gnl/MRDRNA2_/MRDRNA2_34779_c0~~gnl/MRDRNA2_/MRDRNA2_34779_c0_seq1.p1  ORF type:complete len:245 (+),score=42.92 gnl/MRDRNA2_/MRDRNA2_34779_c0_seq1:179-913(+)
MRVLGSFIVLRNVCPILAKNDCYALLQVKPGVSQKELKKAYHKQALKWHPDKNKAPGAAEHFKEVMECFETLSDPVKEWSYRFRRETSSWDWSARSSADARGGSASARDWSTKSSTESRGASASAWNWFAKVWAKHGMGGKETAGPKMGKMWGMGRKDRTFYGEPAHWDWVDKEWADAAAAFLNKSSKGRMNENGSAGQRDGGATYWEWAVIKWAYAADLLAEVLDRLTGNFRDAHVWLMRYQW